MTIYRDSHHEGAHKMEPAEPSTSSALNKETNLEFTMDVFEETVVKPTLEATIKVRRRKRATVFAAEDLLIEITFGEKPTGKNLPLMACLISIYEVLMTLVRKLRYYFDDQKRRLCFFSATTPALVTPIFSGECHSLKKRWKGWYKAL